MVVTICKAMPAVDLEQAVEALAAAADDADEEPVKAAKPVNVQGGLRN